MFTQLIRQTVRLITGRPYKLLLKRQNNQAYDQVILESHKGRKSVPFDRVIGKFPQVAELTKFLPPQDTQKDTFVVPWKSLSAITSLLISLTTPDLEVYIAPEIAPLDYAPIPEQFEIRYFWNNDLACVQQQAWPGAEYVGQAWFINQESYWHVAETTEDSRWLRRKKSQAKTSFIS
jgi:hypothetical protein